jgi:DNA-binding CsgD family transcriptional regulator
LDTARAALQRCITRARDISDDFELWIFLSYLAVTEELAGDYAAASAALQAADALAAWYDWPPNPWQLEPYCRLMIATGDQEAALRIAGELLPDSAGATLAARYMAAYIRGEVSAWRADPAAAVRHFELAAQCADASGWADPGVRNLLDAELAEAYVAVGRPEEARRMASWLREVGERLGRPTLTGDAYRIDALAAAQDGDLDRAAESARAAVAAHEASPLRPELARSLLVLGRIERRRKARKLSREALRRARELAAAMGHRPLLAEIEQELPRVAAARAGPELTATERRVADLIATGATNRDAAAELFVSVRTIETHVASIYRKLGVRTRAELARRLAGQRAENKPDGQSGS